jgi:hypothetical protein
MEHLKIYHITILNNTEGWTWSSKDVLEDNFNKDLKNWIRWRDGAFVPESKEWIRALFWKNTIRNYKKAGTLSQEKINRLNLLEGWGWKRQDLVVEHAHEWQDYYAIHKKIPKYIKTDPIVSKLAGWATKIRKAKRDSAKWLTAERIAILNSLPGWYW